MTRSIFDVITRTVIFIGTWFIIVGAVAYALALGLKYKDWFMVVVFALLLIGILVGTALYFWYQTLPGGYSGTPRPLLF